jgi:hypothetical protein
MMNRWIKYFVSFLLIIIFILSANLISGLLFPSGTVTTSRTVSYPAEPQSPSLTVSQSFPFENSRVNLSFPVNISSLEKTKKTDMIPSPFTNTSGSVQIGNIYRAMVNDPDQGQVFFDLLSELNKVRRLQNLSDDEYLELTAAYVQSLHYESLNQNFAKLPVETIVDGAGDCDDKSLLLAGLLAREGYSVALLSFEQEAHMAIGVSSHDYLYKNTDYAFIETTGYSFIGEIPDKLEGNLSLHSDPTIIIINNGTKSYSSGNETEYINTIYLISDQKLKDLSSQLKKLNDDLMAKQSRISELESKIAQLRNSDNIVEYNSQVSTLKTLISIYNSRLASYNQIYTEYERYAAIHDYIFGHKFDRKGVFDYVKKNIPF